MIDKDSVAIRRFVGTIKNYKWIYWNHNAINFLNWRIPTKPIKWDPNCSSTAEWILVRFFFYYYYQPQIGSQIFWDRVIVVFIWSTVNAPLWVTKLGLWTSQHHLHLETPLHLLYLLLHRLQPVQPVHQRSWQQVLPWLLLGILNQEVLLQLFIKLLLHLQQHRL